MKTLVLAESVPGTFMDVCHVLDLTDTDYRLVTANEYVKRHDVVYRKAEPIGGDLHYISVHPIDVSVYG